MLREHPSRPATPAGEAEAGESPAFRAAPPSTAIPEAGASTHRAAVVARETRAGPIPATTLPPMKEFALNFILSARGGYLYFGLGHEYTPAELFEIIAHFFQ